jgi:hypothetical protein
MPPTDKSRRRNRARGHRRVEWQRRTPTLEQGWPELVAIAGVVALIIAGLWWWSIPPSQRFYECVDQRVNRNGCVRSEGSLGGPAVALTLGMLLVVVGVLAMVFRWIDRPARRRRR